MTTQEWIIQVLSGSSVWNIGQLDQATAKALDGLVRQGKALKARLPWMPTGIMKMVWYRPGTDPWHS